MHKDPTPIERVRILTTYANIFTTHLCKNTIDRSSSSMTHGMIYICNFLGLKFIQEFPETTITRSTTIPTDNPSFPQRTTSELQIWLATSLAARSQYIQEVIIVRELIASASACFVPFNIYDALFTFTSASSGGFTQGGAGTCQFPGCSKPVFPGSSYCSKTHRECASLLISTLILG